MAAGEAVGVELAEHFTSVEQQRRVGTLGMWTWLMTELLLFAGLFLTALVLRVMYPDSVRAAAQHLKMWIGAANTVLLITSSLTMSAGIELSKMGRNRDVSLALLVTGGLGVAFMLLKSYEYYADFSEHMMPFLNRPYALAGDNASQLFVSLYYVTTLTHAVHLTIGIATVATMAWRVRQAGFLTKHQNQIEAVGLYWHFIDLIWIIAYPALYLVNR
jgi:cytochrome c oxidase subunit 3